MCDVAHRPPILMGSSYGSISSTSSADSLVSYHTAILDPHSPMPSLVGNTSKGQELQNKGGAPSEEIWDDITRCPTPSRATTRVPTPLPFSTPSSKPLADADPPITVPLHLTLDFTSSVGATDTLSLDIPVHLSPRAISLGFQLSDSTRPSDEMVAVQKGRVRLFKQDRRFAKARKGVLAKYCGNKYAHFLHLARIIPPGGTSGPDDKLFVLACEGDTPPTSSGSTNNTSPLHIPTAKDDLASNSLEDLSPSPPITPASLSPPLDHPLRPSLPATRSNNLEPHPRHSTVRFLTPPPSSSYLSSSPCSFPPSASSALIPASDNPAPLTRLQEGYPVPEFRDLRANPRCLLEAHLFDIRSQMDQLGVRASVGQMVVVLKREGTGLQSQSRSETDAERGAREKWDAEGEGLVRHLAGQVLGRSPDVQGGDGDVGREGKKAEEHEGGNKWEKEVYEAMYEEWKRLRSILPSRTHRASLAQ